MFYGIKVTGHDGAVTRVEVGTADVPSFDDLRDFARTRRTELLRLHPDVLWWSVVQYGDAAHAEAWREERFT
jgi:hypothetical protein